MSIASKYKFLVKKLLLMFHQKKCSCLSAGKKKSLCEYVLLSHVIEQVDSMKDIGVTIDSNLTFNEHINMLCYQ